jgi:hypothetical protein
VESLLAVSAEAGMHRVQDNDGDSPLVRNGPVPVNPSSLLDRGESGFLGGTVC